jgi:hypothetical protein
VVVLAVRLLHLAAHKALILFLVLLLPRVVEEVHRAEMEVLPLLLEVLVVVAVAAVVVLLKLEQLVLQVKVTLVEMVVQQGKTIPVAVAEALVL